MEDINFTSRGIMDSCAAITKKNTYSAEELAEIFMKSRPDFLGMDMEAATRGWDDKFIFKFLCCLQTSKDIELALAWIEATWKKKYFPSDDYSIERSTTRNNAIQAFHTKLEFVKCAVKNRMEEMNEERDLIKRMLEGYEENKTETDIAPICSKEASDDEQVQYHLSDLPREISNQLLITDDKIYTEFVVTIKGPIKDWIAKRRLQDWNVVRFICRLRGIVTTKCSLMVFGKLLEIIGEGNQECNMKQRKDANDKNAFIAYEDPSNKNQIFWKLKKEGKEIEDLLEDIIQAMAV